MSTHEIALRYSRALFDLATTQEELKEQLSALEQVCAILTLHPEIMRYFCSPHAGLKQKEKAFKTSLAGYIIPGLMGYFIILLRAHRFKYLPEILKEYRRRVAETLGILEGRLITTEPLDSATREKLQVKLEEICGKKLKLKEEVDPQLMGGGIVIAANRLIDFSVRGRLNRLEDDLLSMNI